jgi:hypothetical protein
LKDAKFKDLVDAVHIWVGQVNVKNGAAADEVIREEVEIFKLKCIAHAMWYLLKMHNELKYIKNYKH